MSLFLRHINYAVVIEYFIILLLSCGCIGIFFGIVQWLDYIVTGDWYGTVTGFFENPGPYGGFLAIISPVALFVVRNKKCLFLTTNKYIRHFLIFIAWFNFIGVLFLLPLTFCRSAWVAFLVSSLWIIYKDKTKCLIGGCKFRLIGGGVCLLCLVVGGLFLYRMKADSADGRLLIWKVSLEAGKDKWLLGNGFHSFPKVYGEAQAEYFEKQKGSEREKMLAGAPQYCFNEYIQIFVEWGLVGLLFALGVIFFAFKCVVCIKDSGIRALGGALVSVLVLACFSYPLRVPILCILVISILAVICCSVLRNVILSIGLILCTVLFSFYMFKMIGHSDYWQACKYWRKLQMFFNQGDFQVVVDRYDKIYPYLSDNPSFLFEYGQCLSQTSRYNESNKILAEGMLYSSDPMFFNIMGKNYQKQKRYDLAEKMFLEAANRIPHKIYPYYLLMNMYIECSQLEKAKYIAARIILKPVKIESGYADRIKKEAFDFLYSIES